MSLKDLNPRHLKLISLYSSRYTIRGGTGLVFTILVLSCGLLIAHIILQPIELQKGRGADQAGNEISDQEAMNRVLFIARPVIAWAIEDDSGEEKGSSRPGSSSVVPNEPGQGKTGDWPSYLLDRKPALLSAVLLIMLFASPFLVALGAFNQFSGDVQSRGLRYQLFRTERTNIFIGRFLGTAVYTFIVMALLIGIITVYLGLKVDLYDWGSLMSWSLRGLLALCIVCLPYVALCSMFSGMIDSPFGSLTISSLIIGAVPLFALIGKATWQPAAYINYALPWGVQKYLLHYDAQLILGSAAACLGYTICFLLLGHLYFCKRDL